MHEALKSLGQELKLDGQAHFVGRVDRAGAIALFKGCEWFVLPSRHEPMGIVNLEAMAAGKAVVASRVGGVPELVEDGQNGLLVPPDDPDALALALRRLASDAALSRRLGECGATRARDFDWDAITAQYLEIYRGVLSAQKSVLKTN
jgi:glycosyltransferase involved in cell wall biosynthesis